VKGKREIEGGKKSAFDGLPLKLEPSKTPKRPFLSFVTTLSPKLDIPASLTDEGNDFEENVDSITSSLPPTMPSQP
jgi:hypothetical protein